MKCQHRLGNLNFKIKFARNFELENAQLLKITIEANRRVVAMVADAVKTQQPGPGTYSAKGTADKNDVHSAPRNLALSLDRSL